MAKYVDGYVLPVKRSKLAAYRKMAMMMGKLMKKHGALEYVECVADDVKKGKSTSFPQAVKLKAGEVVVFSYVTYKSRAHRDRTMKNVMADPSMNMDGMSMSDMPFDGMRMFWGGFKPIVSL